MTVTVDVVWVEVVVVDPVVVVVVVEVVIVGAGVGSSVIVSLQGLVKHLYELSVASHEVFRLLLLR